MTSLIELKDISKTYYIGGKIPVYALKNASLSIEAGEFVAIMGSSGSGKSTLLAILGLLDRVESGKYHLLGKDISNFSDSEGARLRNHFFGFVFQSFNLLARLDIVANTMLPFVYANGNGEEGRKRALDVLKRVGLGDRLKHKTNEISGGQQQRVALARALATSPLVILADEPTGNLDTKSAQEIISFFKEINQQGNTVIMVTHEPNLAKEASRIITLSDGGIVSDQKIREVPKRSLPPLTEPKKKRHNLFAFSRLANYFHEAYISIFTNKLRSFLSILGVVIGVAAVIAMLAIGTGAQKQIEKTFASLGSNVLMVRSSSRAHGISLGADSATRFNFTDLEALKKIEGVKAVVPYVNGRAQSVYQNKNWNTTVYGTSPDYQNVRDSVPNSGRFFSESDMNTKAKVAVLGTAVVKELFGGEDPLGKWVKINRINFKVIGVLPEKGMSGFRNADDQIIIPLTTGMYRLLGEDYIGSFDIQAQSADDLTQIQDAVAPLILKLHRLPASQLENIEVRNMADIQKAAGDMINTFSLLLGAIAVVSLLVGGIGIMNIMLVMVMERTHEIGLRKALGAENSDILTQFLMESVLICLFGGVIGIFLGWLIAALMATFAGWNAYVSMGSIILAFTFSVVVGVVFGIWPAKQASRLQPIEALRYE
ncbi:MAG: ABC transporter permease [Candidatus Saganbacteria bacterium]|nr:ABC transporter permease [Candidatus Saganbacteria bacterium]